MLLKKNNFIKFKYIPAAVSGLLLTLCFPKADIWPLAFVALVPLLVSVQSLILKKAVTAGFITGCIHFITLIYWIIPTLNTFGGLPRPIAALVLGALCAYLALYPAVFIFLIKKADFHPLISPLAAACLWTGLEYIRTYAFTGFAWGVLGYSQHANLKLIQLADLTGVYGISFLIVLVNALLSELWTAGKKRALKPLLIPSACTLALAAAVLTYGHIRFGQVQADIADADTVTPGIVQGNIDQDIKWDAAYKNKTLEKYTRLSATLSDRQPDLIIWPETALPFYYGFNRPLSAKTDQCIRSMNTPFLIGSPAFERENGHVRFFNRAYMFNRFSLETGSYDKHHLVPFGEYVPFGKYLDFLGKLTAQAGDFTAGDRAFTPLEFKTYQTGVLICFEILFPSIASDFVSSGAHVLTTITNDAWFGYTAAARQHFSISVFRAVENRRSLIRAANTGISGFIDPRGVVLQKTALFTDAAISQDLPVLKEISFYTRNKDIFAWAAMVAFLICFMLKRLKHRARRR